MVYNESNQLTEAVLCNGRTKKKVCYTYDGDGNLIKEYSPTDNSLTTYQYTVEDRLEAVYTGNAYNRNLQMAAAYDGDGNRVYQVNYNPEKDEDFSCYYGSYNNCDYNGTGIQLRVTGEVSPTEEELIKLIAPAGAVLTSKYELIEYINDVNREYAEVLVEQNINGRTDTTYTYGVDRISRELFNQTCRTSYYLYDPRGSVAGLADGEGHLTKTYRYGVTGELTYGSAAYENEYTYNGESYNPNIHSQYLRARYYNVVTANFLTEDSYLGNINEPLTLNRYNYCISSYLNYVDPSGNDPILPVLGPILPPFPVPSENTDTDTDGDKGTKVITWGLIQMALSTVRASDTMDTIKSMGKKVSTFVSGVGGSFVRGALIKPSEVLYPFALQEHLVRNVGIDVPEVFTGGIEDYTDATDRFILRMAGNVEEWNLYYAGRCTGDALYTGVGIFEVAYGFTQAFAGGAAAVGEAASVGGAVLIPGTLAVAAQGVAIVVDGAATITQGLDMMQEDLGRYQESKDGSGGDSAKDTLTTSQKTRLKELDNIIEHNLKESDFAGTLRDLRSDPIPKPGGGYYNHLQEMKQSYKALNKVKRGLEGSLRNPNLSSIDRGILQKGLDRANLYIQRIQKLFAPFGGI